MNGIIVNKEIIGGKLVLAELFLIALDTPGKYGQSHVSIARSHHLLPSLKRTYM